MVDQHHGTNDLIALGYDAVWARLKGGDKLSAVMDGAHLFSFRLRPKAFTTPATVVVLVGSAYLPAGALHPGAKRLEALPVKFKQAPMDAYERRAVYRLFDADLLQGRLPPEFILVARDAIDAANERAYAAAQPAIHRYLTDRKLITYLNPIRNVGRLSNAQEGRLRQWIKKPGSAPKPREPEPKLPPVPDDFDDPVS